MQVPERAGAAGACVFLGDEVTAAGMRLAGVRCSVTDGSDPAALVELFRASRADAGLLLITAELAAKLPAALLAEAAREQRPPLLVMADIRGRMSPPDLTASLKRQLGLAE